LLDGAREELEIMSCIYSSDILLVILNTFGGIAEVIGRREFAWLRVEDGNENRKLKVYVYFSDDC